ncbi:MAG: RNA polymerase sigma factor [Alphaproteobacteria bacterium]
MDVTQEDDLIRKAQNGDADAFEALVNGRYETMFRMAYKFCGNRQNAEDITQESCIRLARGLDSFRHNSAFTSWLYRLVINTGKDWYRSNNRHPKSHDGLEAVETSGNSETQLHTKQVLAALYTLPEGERDALILVMSDGLSHREAGEILGCKESTISWRIHEARKKLTALFEREQKYG